jgi:hypothetical protein
MNKEKSAGDMGFLNGMNIDSRDGYKVHMEHQLSSGYQGFFVGGRQLGGSHGRGMYIQGADTHGPTYAADYAREEHQQGIDKFRRHQERMAAIVAEQEEDLLILLIL